MTSAPTIPAERHSLRRWRPVAVDDLVRLGRDGDGGYVVSRRAVAHTRVLVGLGISTDWSFEEAFLRLQPAAELVAVDGTVSAAVFRRRAVIAALRALLAGARLRTAAASALARDSGRWWRACAAFASFFGMPRRRFVEKFVAERSDEFAVTLDDLLAPLASTVGDAPGIFVKMDIEGAEYRALPALLPWLHWVTGLVVEFHDCDLLWERFNEMMEALASTFAVVHLHGNNYRPLIPGSDCPRVLEITLVNRMLLPVALAPSAATYPLPGLDMPCDPSRPDHPLSFR